MDREIDLVRAAAEGGCLVVEKESHVAWSPEALDEMARLGQYEEEDCPQLLSDEDSFGSPFPGCLQMGGNPAGPAKYVPCGETQHFIIFTSGHDPGAEGISELAGPAADTLL